MSKFNLFKFTTKYSLLNWILLFFSILQGSSQLLSYLVKGDYASKSSLINIWISLGNEISKNWVTCSISLILLVLGYFLYKRLSDTTSDSIQKSSQMKAIALLIINLALCNKIYSSKSISEKIVYFEANMQSVIVIFIIVLIISVVILMIKNEQKISKELDELPNSNPNSEPNNNQDAMQSGLSPEQDAIFRMKHPFSSAYRSFRNYTLQKRDIKYRHKIELIKIKAKGKQEKHSQKITKVQEERSGESDKKKVLFIIQNKLSVFLSSIASVLLIFSLANDNTDNSIIGSIKSLIKKIIDLTGFDDSELIDALISVGVLFLSAILFIVLFLLIYIAIRASLYLLFNFKDDEKIVYRYGGLIKIFVFGVIDGVLRPLLFIPDFLEHVEDSILDTNLDKKLNDFYPNGTVTSTAKNNTMSTPSTNP